MFLDKLIISGSGKVIREIVFKQGVNLVIDKPSDSDSETGSGNSVGKTTLLRMVDFCFGSDGEDIYKDEEFENPNQEVLDFLVKNNVTANLLLDIDGSPFTLVRSFGVPKILKVGERDFESIDDYRKELEVTLFGIESSEPSLRQVVPKFIRKNNELMSRSIKYLHKNTTLNDYELIYAYFFDVENRETIIQRYITKKRLKTVTDRIKALKKGRTLPALRQVVEALSRDIEELEVQKKTYELGALYDEKLEELKVVKGKNAGLSTAIAVVDTELKMHESTLSELEGNLSKIDPKVLKEMYVEAKSYIQNLDKDFEELLSFHNDLVKSKIKFVSSSIDEKKERLVSLKSEHRAVLAEERLLLQYLSKKGALDDLEGLYERIVKLSEERGRRSQLITEIQDSEDEKTNLRDALLKMEEKFEALKIDLDENISIFNSFFTDYAKKLYAENFLFVYDDSKDSLKFQLDNRDSNVGGGKQKACVTAFDFAYASYLDKKNKHLPRFILHDSIEDIANNQIKTLFAIASEIPVQYVVTIIRDRLDSEGLGKEYVAKLIEENEILSLNESDKFFKF